MVGTPAYAQDKTSEIDKIFSWATPAADLERDVPLTANSIFDAGSLRKQFVAAAILLLVEEGRLSLSDDVRTHVPQLPDYGHKITLDHMLTHTSGLRDWPGLVQLATGDPDAMTMILRQRPPVAINARSLVALTSVSVGARQLVRPATGTHDKIDEAA